MKNNDPPTRSTADVAQERNEYEYDNLVQLT